MADLTHLTPSEIDAELAKLYYENLRLDAQLSQAVKTANWYRNEGAKAWEAEKNAAQYDAKADALRDQINDNVVRTAPFEREYDRRGGWTRAFLVNNSNGHVHRSMHCTTCYYDTSYQWMTDYSGKDEAEIVEAAGERACTVCYPSAPVETLSRPTQMFTKTEQEKAQARAEREAKRAAKEAEKVVVLDYRDYSRTMTKEFKSVRAVTNQIASDLSTLCWYGPANFQAEVHNIERMREALKVKGVEYDYDKALANARKRTSREGGSAKY